MYARLSDLSHWGKLARLNGYLYRFNMVDNPACECGHQKETVQHYLLQCPKYEEQHKALTVKVGPRNMRVEKLLGNLCYVKHALKYEEETGRMEL
jgi:hypothetical protein